VFGLVNGRPMAELSRSERLSAYAEQPIDFVFLNEYQLREVSRALPVQDWRRVLAADFPNARGDRDRHWLMVPPERSDPR
jgi:hypothetical protein